VTGDIRGIQVNLEKPSGAGTVTGTMSCLKCYNNTYATVTGGVYCIDVSTHGNTNPWSGFAKFPDDGQIANDGESKAGGTVGWIKVMIGSKTGYIQVETLA
jgi:hypothetical protein